MAPVGSDKSAARVSERHRTGSDKSSNAIVDRYRDELARLPLADNTRRAYLRYARRYLTFVGDYDAHGLDPLADPHGRDYAVRDFKRHLKTVERLRPATIN